MDAAHRGRDEHRQDPKLECGCQIEGQYAGCQVDGYAKQNHFFASEFLGKHPIADCAREGDDRYHQERQHERVGNESDAVAEDGCHMHDRIHTVDVKEIGDKEKEDLFIFSYLLERPEKPVEAVIVQSFRRAE